MDVWWGARWWCALPLLLLLRAAGVAPALSVAPCDLNEYQPEGSNLCCQMCPAGQYVLDHCTVNHTAPVCQVCEHGTFLPFRSGETSCQPCVQCRLGDQEVVAKCSPTSNEQCRCKEGSFYCNSVNCVENCLRCTRCPGAILLPCTATSDTVCAADPDPGCPENKCGSESPQQNVAVPVVIGIFLTLGIGIAIVYCCKKKGVRVSYQPLVRLLKGRSDGTGSLPRNSSLQPETVRLEMPERAGPVPGTDTQPAEESLALMPEARPQPHPSGEPEEGPELQAGVVGGSPAAPEQTLETAVPATSAAPAPPAAPTALGLQEGTQVSLSLKSLEERYRTEYFLSDKSREVTGRIDCEFVKANLGNDWKTFIRLIGLEETDIYSCECENPGNVAEQHHQMLFTWRKKLGKKASVFRLLAALHKLELHMYLQNIINNLVAEGILGRLVENHETSD
ncbi:uncharacterized protein LOC120233928 isoform X2 [Hyaena hyaena]|uniref:uncharacterized protein LOC120233928 isoform X2 n=1 Tax=Hyaena hyaena TaxID=95912 RepID=UPI001921F721|nr:uncharacterized protein LOC120233928 isoform X2 [Hyaena hyaena]